jgi:hypothetical protein
MIHLKNWLRLFPQQYRTHQNADLPLAEYLELYRDKFKRVKIGCSFDPGIIEQMYERENGKTGISQEKKLQALQVLVEDFGIRDIRLGINWNRVIDRTGKFDFSYYRPFLGYCIRKKLDICLNLGPIKTFGWPEEHIPAGVLSSLSRQPKEVTKDSELAKSALRYLKQLVTYLKKEYTPTEISCLSIVQLDNEPFNTFGKHRLTLQQDYLLESIRYAAETFSSAKILVSSAETRNIKNVRNLIVKAHKELDIDKRRFICGINYYYNLPHFIRLPKVGPVDSITQTNFLQWSTAYENIQYSRKYGYQIEITEAQFEQWGRAYLSPGNSFHECKYLLARCVENILDPQVGGLIRLWGFERYAKRKIEGTLSTDQVQNLELIRKINKL